MKLKVRTRVIHPGKVILNILAENKISQNALAKHLGCSQSHINLICKRRKGISSSIALRLACFFGTSPEMWLNMQDAWNLAFYYKKLHKQLTKIKPLDKRKKK
jgi:addiction module HigA family antidote